MSRTKPTTISSLSGTRLELRLPATSANLGPAFDAAALAFELYLKVQAKPAREFSISAHGRDREICGRSENHLILATYRDVLNHKAKPVIPLALAIENEVPIGKGCGSSAAARLAGIALAVHFGDLKWSDAKIVGEASRREDHPDNAAACWMGGLVVARMCTTGEAEVLKIRPKRRWPLLLALAEQPLSTEEARRVLPAQYSRQDVVANVQNSMMLLGALAQGRTDLLASALDDRIHQPYRAALCPLLPASEELAGRWGVVGAVLSGAGPSVLLFLDPKTAPQKTRQAVASHLKHRGLRAELVLTRIAELGGCDQPGWRKMHRTSG